MAPAHCKSTDAEQHPVAVSGWLTEKTGITSATVNKTLKRLGQLGLVRELTEWKLNRIWSYVGHLEIMNRGMELPSR